MASLNSQTRLHNAISQYQDDLARAATAMLFSVKNFSKNISFQGSYKDWESLPNESSNTGDGYWVQETKEIAVWNGTYWVRLDSALDSGLILKGHECPGVFHSPENPFRQKTEEEKLNDIADALILLALS